MAGIQAVWGIDLGRCALKTIKLRATDDKIELVAHDYIEHARILTQPDADRAELIRSALEKFLSRNDISKDDVVVSVPGQHTLARFTKLPPVAPKRIPDIVRYEADQQIPFDMDEVIWDYQTFQEEGTPDLEVGIFAMKRELVREHLLYFEQASIEPIVVQSGPLAVYNAAHFDGLLGKETTILLDIGAENTDLIIATQHSFWTRTLPIGGNNLTEGLVKSFKLSFSKAEALKRSAEASKYARQIFQAMRPIFADLVQELQRSLGFYSSTHRDAKVEKVVCLGNAFKLPGLQKYLQQNLGLAVQRPESFKKAGSAGAAPDGALKEEFLSFAVAYGLALQGLDLAKVTSNLLPTEIAKQAVWRKKRPWFGAAAACLLLAGGLIYFRKSTDMSALAAASEGSRAVSRNVEDAWDVINDGPGPALSDRAQAEQILEAGSFLRKEISALSGQGQDERAETEQIIELQQGKALVLKILQAIHESVPVPQGPLGEAQAQQQVLDILAEGAAAPRGERHQVLIKTLHMHFEPDVNAYEWSSQVPAPEPINDPESELPAMKIEITCRTPNEDGSTFLAKEFMDTLRTNGRQPETGFYFDRVHLNYGGKVEVPGASRSTSPRTTGRGFGALGSRGGAAPRPAVSSIPPQSLDPITNEPIADDWEFEIWIDAVLEDYPGDDEAETAGAEDGG
jgi:type IV pilus assembly protein PilM